MKNELKYLDEFKQVLKNYEVSTDARQVLRAVNLVLLASPTAVGRNTIINILMKSGGYHFIISDTTRQPRTNNGVKEVSGSEYWFISEEEFLDGLRQHKYLEAAVIHDQQVSGISLRELEKASDENKVAITDIEVQGVNSILLAKPDTHAIFLLPPSFDEWMSRLNGRGEMNEVEKTRRLSSAIDEYSYALQSNKFIYLIADRVEDTKDSITKIVNNEPLPPSLQLKGQKLAEQLLEDTKKALSKK